MRRFPESEYHISFFDEFGYVRKLCPTCGEYFWTQNMDQKTCGESTSVGCAPLTFINNPPTRKSCSLSEIREAFLSFFERRGHQRIKPYPVVARWRDDLYFTSASIVDFQPFVTNGIVPPPSNPLVISQPCIRFVDVDNVGPTFGRHLTLFEMGGHHAFNYPDKEVYWKDDTVRYHHEFVTKQLGVPSEEVFYKEGVWSGGGNAGPDVETIIRGLEVATLVFMKFKVVNDEFIELPIQTVDTGYGLERYAWLSQGSLSCFHAVYGLVLKEILKMAGISKTDDELLTGLAELSGVMNIEKKGDRRRILKSVAERLGTSADELTKTLIPIENAFAVVDHTKCLAFMLSEGVVPSNVREGYLTRLMIRRTHRLLKALEIEDKVFDIIDMQITYWSQDFPYLKEMRDEIIEMLSVEQRKFKQTLKRGGSLVRRVTQELKKESISQIPTEKLIELYDSHGLPPEFVQETAEKVGFPVRIPDNFYRMVAEKHVQPPPQQEAETIKGLDAKVSDLPKTRMLYYENQYLSKFESNVLRVFDDKYVVLEKTAFYPEGGGQPADRGYLTFDGTRTEVVDIQKIGNVIVHVVKGPVPKREDRVLGFIDWERRSILMKQHDTTHIIMGAVRRVLGEHAWQAGSQKGVERSRIDISHYKRLTLEEIHEIERLANEVVLRNDPIETVRMPREEAEKLYGFRLYQGGVVPGRMIRVVKTKDWEVEACGGTHGKTTGEIGFTKILHTERIQDGIERIVFSTGLQALKDVQESERTLRKLSGALNAPINKVVEVAKRLVTEWKGVRSERERLIGQVSIFLSKEYLETAKEILGLKVITRVIKGVDKDRLIKIASEIVKTEPRSVVVLCGKNKTANLVVMAGKDAVKRGVNARDIAGKAASMIGGAGSGREDFAQGGGVLTEKVTDAMQMAEEIIRKQTERAQNVRKME